MSITEFAPSQLSYTEGTSPFTFRLSPFRLLWLDFLLILKRAKYAPFVLSPFWTHNPTGELYLGRWGNVSSMLLNVLLFVFSAVGIGGIFVLLGSFVPVVGAFAYGLVAVAVCLPVTWYLNSGMEIPSTLETDEFPDEKWFFINGIIVGDWWQKSAIDTLSMLFKRKVCGIRNRTNGFILDIIECFIQRDLGYTTQDIRDAYEQIKDALIDDKIKRVVVIAHSQGGIIISSALDNLLADLPREYFQQLEIYTFASAASHFNNPRLLKDTSSKATVSYIEHYANESDFVARFGVLEFLPFQATDRRNVYAGRLFTRPNASGHMFVQHYMDPMFGPGNQFLDSRVVVKQLRKPTETEPVPPGQTVRELSRFAAYLAGGKPK